MNQFQYIIYYSRYNIFISFKIIAHYATTLEQTMIIESKLSGILNTEKKILSNMTRVIQFNLLVINVQNINEKKKSEIDCVWVGVVIFSPFFAYGLNIDCTNKIM